MSGIEFLLDTIVVNGLLKGTDAAVALARDAGHQRMAQVVAQAAV